MAFDPDRIVHRRRHDYRDPKGNSHRFWTVGCAPEGEALEGHFAPMSADQPGAGRQGYLRQAFLAFARGFIADSDAETIVAAEAARAAWKKPAGRSGMSPAQGAELRFAARLEWYVCANDNGHPGDLLRERSFTFPTSCEAEGLLQDRIYPGDRPNLQQEDPNTDNLLLQPTQSEDPSVVAKWWACFHFGFPRSKNVRMQEPKTKVELTHGQ